jgi:hypothetical protein
MSNEELTEMESVIYSISFGKQSHQKRILYQAFSAAISQQIHVDLVMSFIARRQKIREAKTCVVAYRLSRPQDDNDKMSNVSLNSSGNQILEGFDDGNEEGCGEKLLSQLQKMGVENILIIVYIWH